MAERLTAAQRRKVFSDVRAPKIAQALGAPPAREESGWKLSTNFAWFGDDDRLVVIGWNEAKPGELEFGLAYGLAHAGDRDLWLVLPRGRGAGVHCRDHDATARRLAWIDAPVRLFTYDSRNQVAAAPVLTRDEVRRWAAKYPPVTHDHDLGDRGPWVDRLLEWADHEENLVAAHRSSYLAWHCAGRMVLKIRKAKAALVVSAGVHHTAPGKEPRAYTLTGPLGAAQFHRLVARASGAIADRLEGLDEANAEHLLQEQLAGAHRRLGLLGRPRREVPAVRANGHRAYVDLLGVDDHSTMRVIETKIGPDPMIALQGLDYWIWCEANRKVLAPLIGADPSHRPQLDLMIVDDGKGLLSPYTSAQLEALDGAIRWRLHRVEPGADGPTVAETWTRRVPAVDRPKPARYHLRLQEHLRTTEPDLVKQVFHATPGGGLLPAALPHYEQLAAQHLLHGFVDHVRSSQAFALNLFASIPPERLLDVWALLDPAVVAHDELVFEWSDPDDVLAESQPAHPHRTQVDVLLRGRTATGGVRVALVEVKLSETGFGTCSAFDDADNPTRRVCHQPGPWGGDAAACWQLANKGGPHRRRYDEYLPLPAGPAPTLGGCPFRTLNQPMRNVALARSLVARGDAEHVTFALCAPPENRVVWRQWAETKQLFAGLPGVTLADLSAADVASLASPEDRQILEGRYLTTAGAP